MKKNIFYILVFLPLLGSCQNRWQTVNYNGVSVQIPAEWGNKNTVNLANLDYEYSDFSEYLISCWSKDKETNMLAIHWIETEIDNNLRIEGDIKRKRELFPMYKQLKFDDIIDLYFLGLNAKKCHFYGNLTKDISIEGEYITFTKNRCSFMIIIGGDEKFYQSNDYNHILKSIKPILGKIVPSKENKTKTTGIGNNFTQYEFRDYIVSVPNTMELRNENSYMSLGKEIRRDGLKTIKKIDIGEFNFVFQPAGLDNIQNKEIRNKALALYSRVLINHIKGANNDFYSWDADIQLSQAEYNKANNIYKNMLLEESKDLKQKGINIELLNIRDIKIAKNTHKFVYIMHEYERSGLNGNVKVVDYYLHNNNEMVKLTISYRISERSLWETDFNKIINTFSFNSKK